MGKVRRIVHPKWRPFHFKVKTYYLSDANYRLGVNKANIGCFDYPHKMAASRDRRQIVIARKNNKGLWTVQFENERKSAFCTITKNEFFMTAEKSQ